MSILHIEIRIRKIKEEDVAETMLLTGLTMDRSSVEDTNHNSEGDIIHRKGEDINHNLEQPHHHSHVQPIIQWLLLTRDAKHAIALCIPIYLGTPHIQRQLAHTVINTPM